jgi:glyoxylase-like metal-dependent hydrolase (beta-lactamase superfamily II)
MTLVASGIAGVHASAPHPLPFAPDLHIRAFLIERPRSTLLVYGAPTVDPKELAERGGAARHYLNHWHEATFLGDAVAPLFVNERDREATERSAEVAHVFSKRHVLDGDFEVIPTPGHTPGATAFLWDNGERRLLFTGDTVYLRDGEWVSAVLDSSDPAAYAASLELMRELEFDVLVPWAASADQPYYAETDREDARRRLDVLIERVRNAGV